jgi:hypothetical protein
LRTVAFFAAVLAAPKARAVRTPDLASILTERVSALETAGFGVYWGVESEGGGGVRGPSILVAALARKDGQRWTSRGSGGQLERHWLITRDGPASLNWIPLQDIIHLLLVSDINMYRDTSNDARHVRRVQTKTQLDSRIALNSDDCFDSPTIQSVVNTFTCDPKLIPRHPGPLQNNLRRSRLRIRLISSRLHLRQLAGLRALCSVHNSPRNLDRLHAVLRLSRLAVGSSLRRHLLFSRRVVNELAIRATRLALPASLEELAHLEAGESMGFGVEDDVGEREMVVRGEEEVEVFEGFRL